MDFEPVGFDLFTVCEQHFLTFLSVDIYAEEYSVQFNNIINDLKLAFNCDDFEAEHYYYNNALKLVVAQSSIKF